MLTVALLEIAQAGSHPASLQQGSVNYKEYYAPIKSHMCRAMWKYGLDLDDTTKGNSAPYQLGPLFSFLQGPATWEELCWSSVIVWETSVWITWTITVYCGLDQLWGVCVGGGGTENRDAFPIHLQMCVTPNVGLPSILRNCHSLTLQHRQLKKEGNEWRPSPLHSRCQSHLQFYIHARRNPNESC